MHFGVAHRWEPVLDAVLPRRCAGCRRPFRLWCRSCFWHVATTRPRLDPPPEQCPPLLAIGGEHQGPLRGAVLLFKRQPHQLVTAQILGVLAMALAIIRRTLGVLGDRRPLLLVPVPSSRRRPQREPTRDLAVRLTAGSTWVRYAPLLRTVVRRQPQKGLDASARARNVAGSFAVVGPPPAPSQALVLLDDVVTTGATLAEAHHQLRSRGHPASAALCISRAVADV